MPVEELPPNYSTIDCDDITYDTTAKSTAESECCSEDSYSFVHSEQSSYVEVNIDRTYLLSDINWDQESVLCEEEEPELRPEGLTISPGRGLESLKSQEPLEYYKVCTTYFPDYYSLQGRENFLSRVRGIFSESTPPPSPPRHLSTAPLSLLWLQEPPIVEYRFVQELTPHEQELSNFKDFRSLAVPEKRWRENLQKYYAGRNCRSGERRVRYDFAVEDIGANYRPFSLTGRTLMGPEDIYMLCYQVDVPEQPPQRYRELAEDYETRSGDEKVIEVVQEKIKEWAPPAPNMAEKKRELVDYCRKNRLGMCCRRCAKIEKAIERREGRKEWRAFWREAGGMWRKGDDCLVPPRALAHTEENRACCHSCYFAVRSDAPWDHWDWGAPKAWYGDDWMWKEGVFEVDIDRVNPHNNPTDITGRNINPMNEPDRWPGYWEQYPLEWSYENEVRSRSEWGVLVDWAVEDFNRNNY